MKIIENIRLMEFNTPNRNGRIYSKDVVMKGISHLLEKDQIPGELEQPYEPMLNLQNVSHYWTNLHSDDRFLYGDLTILDTPSGQTLQNILNVTPVYVASRGIGEIDENGKVENIDIKTFDIVLEGGFENCKING